MSTTPRGTLGRYTPIRKLAQGGMAEVFLAKSYGAHGFEKPVAIKRILPTYARDAQFVSMLIDEARITSRLNHPNIVPVMDFSAHGENCYLVMEYVPGRSLANLQRALEEQDRSVSVEHLIHITKETAAGLHHAHTKTDRNGQPLHIVHRDVSPQNILLSFEGFVKVIDFGIARARDRLAKTEVGMLKGKIRYLAPEQVDGGSVDGRTDLFALGIVLWESLTRRILFDGNSDVEVMDQILGGRIPDPRTHAKACPEELARACMKALQRRPEDRYASCEAFSADLRGILARLNPDYDPSALGGLLRTTFADEMEEDAREEAAAEAALAAQGLLHGTDENGAPAPAPVHHKEVSSRDNAVPLRAPASPRRASAEKGKRAADVRRGPPQDVPTVPDDADGFDDAPTEAVTMPPVHQEGPAKKAAPSRPRPQAPAKAAEGNATFYFLGGLSAVVGAGVAVVIGLAVTRPQASAPGVAPVEAPAPARARVALQVSPEDAIVSVDGQAAAPMDGVLMLPAGTHKVQAQAPRHKPLEMDVTLAGGEARTLSLKLVPMEAAPVVEAVVRAVRVTGRTPGLRLEVDGVAHASTTPVTLQLPDGEHTIKAIHPKTGKARLLKVDVGQDAKSLKVDL